jgi:hypothetical protein
MSTNIAVIEHAGKRLSRLQKRILRLAFRNKQREARPFGARRGADAYFAEILADLRLPGEPAAKAVQPDLPAGGNRSRPLPLGHGQRLAHGATAAHPGVGPERPLPALHLGRLLCQRQCQNKNNRSYVPSFFPQEELIDPYLRGELSANVFFIHRDDIVGDLASASTDYVF